MQDILLSKLQYFALLKRLDEINERMGSLKINPGPGAEYITNDELMSLLQLSKRTALRWRTSGRLPFMKIERKLYYRVETILNSFSIRPNSTVEAEQTPPNDPQINDIHSQTGCERCPLYVIFTA